MHNTKSELLKAKVLLSTAAEALQRADVLYDQQIKGFHAKIEQLQAEIDELKAKKKK